MHKFFKTSVTKYKKLRIIECSYILKSIFIFLLEHSLLFDVTCIRHMLDRHLKNTNHCFLWFYLQYLSTVIPYRPSDGRPTVERLQIYLTCKLCCVC